MISELRKRRVHVHCAAYHFSIFNNIQINCELLSLFFLQNIESDTAVTSTTGQEIKAIDILVMILKFLKKHIRDRTDPDKYVNIYALCILFTKRLKSRPNVLLQRFEKNYLQHTLGLAVVIL